MRILELHLLAFGPFSDLRLDFSAPAPALHVIYGPNEAGKSTALRAISGFLYGIPHITPDDHRHRAPDLRVGGRLENAAGQSLAVVRRKGRVKTLFDENEQASDDSLLRPFLGGVSEDLFRTMFGLNHETLRQGAEALLAGGGDVGESLFGAGLGGAGLHQVLTELRAEAEKLFTPQARIKPVNEAIRAVLDAQKRARDAAILPTTWEAHERDLAEVEAERGQVDAEAREVRAREKKLRRAQRVLPLLEARRTLTAAREALGDVTLLPEQATREREEATTRAADAEATAARLRREMAALHARREALSVPLSLVELSGEAVDDLQNRLGSHRKATVDLPRVRGELRALEDEVRAALRRLGREPSLEQVDAPRLDVATEARIKKLARLQGEVETAPRAAARLLADRQERREAHLHRLGELPEAVDVAPLRRVLGKVQRQGDLEHRLREAEESARQLGSQAAALRNRLGILPAHDGVAGTPHTPHAPATIAALPVPTPEAVARFEAERAGLAQKRDLLAKRAEEQRTRIGEIAREIEALQRAGEVPTEGYLVEIRGRRDLAFQGLMRALGTPRKAGRGNAASSSAALFDAAVRSPTGRVKDPAGASVGAAAGSGTGATGAALATGSAATERGFSLSPTEEVSRAQPEAYAELVKQADTVADRLRREADRVACLARLLADRKAAEGAQEQLDAEQKALAAREQELEAAWDALWAPSGIAPRSPAEMRGWLSRHAALCTGVDRLREAEDRVDAMTQQLAALGEELRTALEAAHARETRATSRGARAASSASTPGVTNTTPPADPGAADVAGLLEAATRRLRACDDADRERQDIARQLTALDREIASLDKERAEHEAALTDFRATWAASVARLGLGPHASPEEAIAILDELAELHRKMDEAAHARRRVIGMERDAQQLAGVVTDLVAAHAPDLADLAVDVAADTLLKRYHKGRADQREGAELGRQIDDRQRALAEEETRRAAAEARLARLRAAAHAADLDALVEAEARAREARDLDRRIRDTEEKLLDAGEGSSTAALTEETAGLERDTLAVELERAEERVRALEERRQKLDRQLGTLEAKREQLRNPVEDAAEAAAESSACVARLRTQVDRYVRARLAALILEREIERYREQNQGPILGRASALFRKLTREAYTGLKVSFDDQDKAVLRCVRTTLPRSEGPLPAPGTSPAAAAQMGLPGETGVTALAKEIPVEGLSDGTRDQLYLALRLASLEHHARRAEPMPLVLDDILIHFDDDRARAALEALAEMAASSQILFFTHHARLLELSREAVPAGVLHEHRLR
ncbi:ATP-binding protein [Chondromyces apiculatus]|uniref:Chromosome partition protein smc n=1 Tax=Chondromyces apiculatus DSM 436 TaxID=1192034 RepID=A0A017T979_9BACT|nr:YhaN family protein [Chondromyces apiculatus]EYF05828.1 Chromosome partition protein smc [Chondromyces apiculatus DSM 436]